MPTISSKHIVDAYKSTLPKYHKITFMNIIFAVSAILSILSFFIGPYTNSNYYNFIYTTIYIIFGVCVLLYFSKYLYTCIFKRRFCADKRFVNAVHYTHYVNHIVRDYIHNTNKQNDTAFQSTTKDIVTAISECFSLVTGNRCRCCIKVITPLNTKKSKDKTGKTDALKVITLVRDQISDKYNKIDDTIEINLKENTDFINLVLHKDNCFRHYYAENIPLLYAKRLYNSTSIPDNYQSSRYLEWPLPYKSALTVPIRYTANMSTEENEDNTNNYGFLCLDSNRKYNFAQPELIELAGTFADCIFLLYDITNNFTRKKKQ